MKSVKLTASPVATLIGDVVGSRQTADRAGLHQRVSAALAAVASSAIDPPAFTVGDEFQGSYPTVGAAIDAALSMRLEVAPEVDVRFGIGWGEVTILDPATGIQDDRAGGRRVRPSSGRPGLSSSRAWRICAPRIAGPRPRVRTPTPSTPP